MESDLSGRISSAKAQHLFYNGETDAADFIRPLQHLAKQEVRQEEKRINPFAHIEDRNAEMDRVRREAALISDANQKLFKGPKIVKEEMVSLESLPTIVRQLAEKMKTKK